MATYDALLALDNKLNTHQRHLQFPIPYSLRRGISPSIPNANTQKYGINSLNFRGSVLWTNLLIRFKKCKFLQELKLLLKQCGNLQ